MSEIKHAATPWTIRVLQPGDQPETGLGCFEILECLTSPYPTADATEALQDANAAFIVEACNNYESLKARNADLEAIVQRLANNKSGELIVYNNLRAEARKALANEKEPA